MTIEQTKASIAALLNQQATNTLIDNLATISVANEELKAKIAELEAKVVALTPKVVEAVPVPAN